MSRRNRKLFAAAAGLSIAMILTGGTAYARTSAETVQVFETGAVDIKLESSLMHGTGLAGIGRNDVTPGQKVQLSMDICNKAEPCYVRARYGFSRYEDALEDSIFGTPDNWMFNSYDGYWYCTSVLKGSDRMNFFKGFKVPGDIPLDDNGGFTLTVKAEALQQSNFTPDYGSRDPWKGVRAEENTEISCYASAGPGDPELKIVYEGEADRLICQPDDFFSGLPALMPGDSHKREIKLKNDSGSETELFFCSVSDDRLAQKMDLTIFSEIGGVNRQVYKGPLASRPMDAKKNEILLGTLGAGEEGSMTFVLDVPEGLQNRYAAGKGSAEWIFSTEHIDVPGALPLYPVDTGDRTASDWWFMLLAAGCAMLVTSGIVFYRADRTDRL